jgi:hypothetical protein
MNWNGYSAAVSQDDTIVSDEGQAQRGDLRERKSEEASEACIYNGFSVEVIARTVNCEGYGRLVMNYSTRNHCLVRLRVPPKACMAS